MLTNFVHSIRLKFRNSGNREKFRELFSSEIPKVFPIFHNYSTHTWFIEKKLKNLILVDNE